LKLFQLMLSVCPEGCLNNACELVHGGEIEGGADERMITGRIGITCCHSECLGGCYGLTKYDCFVCAHVLHRGACEVTCPPGLYSVRLLLVLYTYH